MIPFCTTSHAASDKAPCGAMKSLPCLGQRLLLFDYCWLTRNDLELIHACVLIERVDYGLCPGIAEAGLHDHCLVLVDSKAQFTVLDLYMCDIYVYDFSPFYLSLL